MTIAALSFLGTVLLYVLYLAYCTLRVARDNGKLAKAPKIVQGLAWAILIIGYGLDIVFNVTAGTVMFLEFPHYRRLTFTARCSSHLDSAGWRADLARYFCDGWLNPFEEGHCR